LSLSDPPGSQAYAIIAVLMLVVLGIFAGRIWLDGKPVAPEAGLVTDPATAEVLADAAAQREKSIAVLPFEIHGAPRENAALLADGIRDGLLTRLIRIHGLKVISRSSVNAYVGDSSDPRRAARELDVAHILLGDLELGGSRLQIALQMVDAETGAILWSSDYEIGISTEMIFQIQRDTVLSLLEQLGVERDTAESDRLNLAPTDDLDAYRAVLKAREYGRRQGFDALQRATRHAREAVILDPDYADAHVALAATLTAGIETGSLERAGAEAQIVNSIDRALKLDPGNAAAWSALGHFRSAIQKSDFSAAYEAALDLAPGDARTRVRYGSALLDAREPQRALDILLRAAELDPLSGNTLSSLGRTWATLQRHRQAGEAFARARSVDPGNSLGYSLESASWMEQGRIDQGLFWLGRAQTVDPGDPGLAARILFAYDDLEHWGSAAGWSLWLDGWITSQPLPLAMQARHYYLEGDFELALQYANLAMNLNLGSSWISEAIFLRIKRDEAIGNGDPSTAIQIFLERYPALTASPPLVSSANLEQAVQLGFLLNLGGRRAQAQQLLEAAIEVYEQPYSVAGPQNFHQVPLKAEALALLGRNEEALDELERIINSGWRFNWRWTTDLNASFNGVRDTAEFKSLVQRLATDIAEQRAAVIAMEADGTIAPPAPLPENGLLGR
jgi:TolB-like protein/Tfp pilus assembly protein PilF